MNNKILSQHEYKISQAKDGRWTTYLKDSTSKYGRQKIVKPTEQELKTYLINYYKNLNADNKMTFKIVFEKWVNYQKDLVSISTVNRN